MGDLVLKGATSGQITLTPTGVAGTNTLTLPAATGTVNTSGAVNQVPAGSAAAPAISPTGDTNTGVFFPAADTVAFSEGGVESARFDSSGNLLVGTTSVPSNAGSGAGWITANTGFNGGLRSRNGNTGAYSANTFSFFWTGAAALYVDATNLGNITISSDYRIKTNVVTASADALSRIQRLRPVAYQIKNYKNLFFADGVTREGFIAHELAEIIPSAVDGEKDAENQIQSLRLDALCSVMVKAIQELSAELNEAKARIAALEAK